MRVYTVPYEYVEYPKWITLPDGQEVIVQSRDEEQARLCTQEPAKRRGRPPKAEQ